MRPCSFFALVFSASLLTAPPCATAQTSVGFSDPSQLQTLLDHRLPDWTSRVWSASFGLSGNGSDRRVSGRSFIDNRFATRLGTSWYQNREGEKTNHSLGVNLLSDYQRSHSGNETSETSGHDFTGSYTIEGTLERYLNEGPFSARGTLREHRLYTEDISSFRTDGVTTHDDSYRRFSDHAYGVGLAVGRVRDVTPLLRAERLAERLVALGHPRPDEGQVRRIAEVLAKGNSYSQVFQRPERHFWRDVLEPLLGAERALSPFEIMYLTEVLNESLGDRRQGLRLGPLFTYQDGRSSANDSDSSQRRRSVGVDLVWYRNLSLTRQVFCAAGLWYNWTDQDSGHREFASSELTLGHLWNLTDRHLLENTLRYESDADIAADGCEKWASHRSTLRTWVEDRLSLDASATLNYTWRRQGDEEYVAWSWSYALGLTYYLDRILF